MKIWKIKNRLSYKHAGENMVAEPGGQPYLGMFNTCEYVIELGRIKDGRICVLAPGYPSDPWMQTVKQDVWQEYKEKNLYDGTTDGVIDKVIEIVEKLDDDDYYGFSIRADAISVIQELARDKDVAAGYDVNKQDLMCMIKDVDDISVDDYAKLLLNIS